MPLCWTAGLQEVCFVHLGKYGDIIIMLPAFKAVADELGKPVICLVSADYHTIFDGVSYVQPWPLALHWWKGVANARKIAESAGLNPIVVKWWDEPNAKPPICPEPAKTITLTIHGRKCTIPANEWDSFQASQWRYAGFTMEQMLQWPLIFDRRDGTRESVLRSRTFRSNKPKLLINLPETGTSPFKSSRKIISLLAGGKFELVHLSQVRAFRIYDLLGLYDHAAGLITSDTATLHLAAASSIPYIAFLNNGGAGSIPKGNCVLSIRYSEVDAKMGELLNAVGSFS